MKCQIYLTPTSMIQPIFSKPSSRVYQSIIGKKERHLYKRIQNEGLESVKFNIVITFHPLTAKADLQLAPLIASQTSAVRSLQLRHSASTAFYLKPQTQSLTLYVLSLQTCLIPFRLFMNSHDLHPKSS